MQKVLNDDGADAAEQDPRPSSDNDPLGPLRTGTIIDGKYRVDRIIGRGGMGVVVQATHLGLGEQVALKFLQIKGEGGEEDGEGDFRARFTLEARVCAKLRNEHIVRVHDVGIWREKTPFMVMDYLEGTDLRREIRQKGRIPVARATSFVVQICEGLAAAHAQGIIHRDLKPPNIFITKGPDGSDLIKVLDFGISKWASAGEGLSELTKAGVMLGSPKYMSPEQLNGATIDARADIWSIGAMFYTMLTGRPPYDFSQVTQTFLAIASGAPPATPSSIEPGVPPELDALILRCLSRDPAERFQNVAELAGAALEAVDSPFAHQVRDVLYGVLEPESFSSSRPRASLMSLTTGSHAVFAVGSELGSVTRDGLDPARLARARRLRARASWGVAGGIALVAVLALARGSGEAPAVAQGSESVRTRGLLAKSLVRVGDTLMAAPPPPEAPQARARTTGRRGPTPVTGDPVQAPAPASLATSPPSAQTAPPSGARARVSNALDDRQ